MVNSYNLREINQEQFFDLARFHIQTGQNTLVLGKVGSGKTQISQQAINNLGYEMSYINLSVIERVDLAGYINVFSEGDTMTFKSPYYLPYLKEGEKPNRVLLFDEVDKAAPETTAPLLEILQQRTINGRPLNIVSCILTGNLINEQTYSNIISQAILDRCFKYILKFDFYKWVAWARKNNIHDLVIGFLLSNPELACGDIETAQMANPTPRGWESVSKAIQAADKLKITDIDSITNIVAAGVGEEAGIKFETYWKYSRKYESIIHSLVEKGIYNIEYHKLEPIEQLVFVIMSCRHAKNKIIESNGKKKVKYLENVCEFMIDQNVAPEVRLVGLDTFDGEMLVNYDLYKCKLFEKINKELMELVEKKK